MKKLLWYAARRAPKDRKLVKGEVTIVDNVWRAQGTLPIDNKLSNYDRKWCQPQVSRSKVTIIIDVRLEALGKRWCCILEPKGTYLIQSSMVRHDYAGLVMFKHLEYTNLIFPCQYYVAHKLNYSLIWWPKRRTWREGLCRSHNSNQDGRQIPWEFAKLAEGGQ